jgi:hypothetical protein
VKWILLQVWRAEFEHLQHCRRICGIFILNLKNLWHLFSQLEVYTFIFLATVVTFHCTRNLVLFNYLIGKDYSQECPSIAETRLSFVSLACSCYNKPIRSRRGITLQASDRVNDKLVSIIIRFHIGYKAGPMTTKMIARASHREYRNFLLLLAHHPLTISHLVPFETLLKQQLLSRQSLSCNTLAKFAIPETATWCQELVSACNTILQDHDIMSVTFANVVRQQFCSIPKRSCHCKL